MLVAIQNPYALDGRVTTYPREARGYAPSNCFLLVEGRHGLLLDTGFTVHESQVLSALHDAGADELELSIFALRLGEYDSICNIRPIVERFRVTHLYGAQRNGLTWVDFRPEWTAAGTPVGSPRLDRVQYVHVRSNARIAIDPDGVRTVDAVSPLLRLLNTHWVYDAATETLFTSDSFTYVTRPTEAGPWVTSDLDSLPSVEEVAGYLESTRYWWLHSADGQRLIDEMHEVIGARRVSRLAPAYGCVIEGAEVVAAHIELLEQAIRRLAEKPAEVAS